MAMSQQLVIVRSTKVFCRSAGNFIPFRADRPAARTFPPIRSRAAATEFLRHRVRSVAARQDPRPVHKPRASAYRSCFLWRRTRDNGRLWLLATIEPGEGRVSWQHWKICKPGALIRGLAPGGAAKVVHVEWFGGQAIKVTFEDSFGAVRNRLVYLSRVQGSGSRRRSIEIDLDLLWRQGIKVATPLMIREIQHCERGMCRKSATRWIKAICGTLNSGISSGAAWKLSADRSRFCSPTCWALRASPRSRERKPHLL
jgi:hypothetical protein